MKKLNKDIRKMVTITIVALLVTIAAVAGMYFLYLGTFYPVRVNGQVVMSRRIIRYGMYAILLVIGLVAGLVTDAAETEAIKLLKIRKRKMRRR